MSREYNIFVPESLKDHRRQYGLKHHVTSTVHSRQGDTLHKIATEISLSNEHYRLQYNKQVVVLLSRTKKTFDVIFIGIKNETINCLILLIKKTVWSDYMEKVISVVDVSIQCLIRNVGIFTHDLFPFELNNVPLPQCNTGLVYF